MDTQNLADLYKLPATQCPHFNAGITARLAGQPLSQSHQQLHSQRFHEVTDGS